MTEIVSLSPGSEPEAISAYFEMRQVGEPVIIYEGVLSVIGATSSSQVENGLILLEWTPSPTIKYRYSSDVLSFGQEHERVIVATDKDKATFSAFGGLTGLQFTQGKPPEIKYQGVISKTTSEPPKELRRVVMHLVNFQHYNGKPIQFLQENGFRESAGRMEIESDEWRLVVDETRSANTLFREFPSEGSFAITHAVELTNKLRSVMTSREAASVCEALVYFFALLRGYWCGPVLIMYEDVDGKTWLDARLRNTSQWGSESNWFPKLGARMDGALDKLWSKFLFRWYEPLWKSSLQQAIYWYVTAREFPSAETGLTLNCTALELLFWTYLVEHNGVVAEKDVARGGKYRELHEKIRRLVQEALVDQRIPQNYQNLQALVQTPNKPSDGPTVITEIRNKIVHPKMKKGQSRLDDVPPLARIEANRLASIYLEEVLLYILGYSGPRNQDRSDLVFVN